MDYRWRCYAGGDCGLFEIGKVTRLGRLDEKSLRILEPAIGGETEYYRTGIASGDFRLYKRGDTRFVLSVDGSTLVANAVAGRDLYPIAAWIYKQAKAGKFTDIRLHTKRPGLIRMLNKKYNFRVAQLGGDKYGIYRMKL